MAESWAKHSILRVCCQAETTILRFSQDGAGSDGGSADLGVVIASLAPVVMKGLIRFQRITAG
ncbi:hypothetical protein RCH23_000806 [Cryobacterium sp. CAN_C3]|nr:hypothetical protein [Cryobacterium sp. CAN_C3]